MIGTLFRGDLINDVTLSGQVCKCFFQHSIAVRIYLISLLCQKLAKLTHFAYSAVLF